MLEVAEAEKIYLQIPLKDLGGEEENGKIWETSRMEMSVFGNGRRSKDGREKQKHQPRQGNSNNQKKRGKKLNEKKKKKKGGVG